MPKIQTSGKVYRATPLSGVDCSLFGLSVVIDVMKANAMKKLFGYPFYALTFDLKKGHATEWIDEKKYDEACDKIMTFISKNGFEAFEKIKKRNIQQGKGFREKISRWEKQIPDLNDQKLMLAYGKFMKSYIQAYGIGVITFLYEHILSERLSSSFLKKDPQATEWLGTLLKTDYQSFMLESERALLKIKETKEGERRKKLVKKYLRNFFFMGVNYHYSPKLTAEDVLQRCHDAHRTLKREDPGKELRIRLDPEEEKITKLLRITESIRDQRKKINLMGSYLMYRFLEEAGKRTDVPISLIEKALWFEFPELFRAPAKMRGVLENRREATGIFDGKEVLFFESNQVREIEKPKENETEIRGTPASRGVAIGTVKVIIRTADFSKLETGEILVTQMTRPDYLPIMSKAGAIVTDEGGLTCHAAIVCRELGIPCIVGTKVGTRVFKDGNRVEVDANQGKIKKI